MKEDEIRPLTNSKELSNVRMLANYTHSMSIYKPQAKYSGPTENSSTMVKFYGFMMSYCQDLKVQLFVKNFPLHFSIEKLKSMFSDYGRVYSSMLMVGKRNGMYVVRAAQDLVNQKPFIFPIFAQYMDADGAVSAVKQLDGRVFNDYDPPLTVEINQVIPCQQGWVIHQL